MSFPFGNAAYPRWSQNYIPTQAEWQSWFSRKADDAATYGAISSLAAQITSETIRAKAAEQANATAIASETARATGVEATLLSRIEQIRTVKDFGAKGDGSADDTTAFKAAIAAGDYVYVPQGNYVITDATVVQGWQYFCGPGVMVINGWDVPASRFVNIYVNLPVPALFPSIQSAVDWFDSREGFGLNGFVSINLADGAYTPSQVTIRSALGANFLQIVGNTTTPANVTINADMTNNKSAFYISEGAGISNLNGMTITGTGAWQSHGVWNSQCYGGGVWAEKNAVANIGAAVSISKCYYGVRANYGASVFCAPGVSVSEAGDVGFHAFGGSKLNAQGCTASLCSDVTAPTVATLGSGFMAEGGSFMDVSGSTAFSNTISGFVAQNGSSSWCHGCVSYSNGSHGFQSNNASSMECNPDGSVIAQSYTNAGNGFHSESASFLNANSSKSYSNTGSGYYAKSSAYMDITVATATSNDVDGFTAYYGSEMGGNGAVANSNKQQGFQANSRSSISGENLSANSNTYYGYYAIAISLINLGTGWGGANNTAGISSPEMATIANGNTGNLGSYILTPSS